MKYTQRKTEYLNIRDAALKYEVSRSKLHRLVRSGQLCVQTDPRDGRASLLNSAELEAFFSTSEGADSNESAGTFQANNGYLTAEARARIDALRIRATGGQRLSENSADFIQVARDSRSQIASDGSGNIEP
jgi:hypothetical protein